MQEAKIGRMNVRVELRNKKTGKVITREGHNAVTKDGMAMMVERLFSSPGTGSGPHRIVYLQLGKSGAVASSVQTNVLTPIAVATLGERQTAQTIATSGARTLKWEHTWTAGEFFLNGLEEVGLFAASSKSTGIGTMFARFVFTTVNKTSSDTLKITWTVRVS